MREALGNSFMSSRFCSVIAAGALSLGAIAVGVENAEAQRGRGGGGPTIGAEAVGDGVQTRGAVATFRISVEIPRGHHGYVDRGDEGFYIPFSFTFPELDAVGVETKVVSRPEGVRDDDVKAFVLRGRGEFAFEATPADRIRSLEQIRGSLRYQVCNDRTGVCYPPKRLQIDVPVG